MYGEIITIGNELISGRILDSNAWYAAGRLTASGLSVTRITTVGDDPNRLSEALKSSLKKSKFVIVTGGLGSTEDDMTNEIVANALNLPLNRDREMFQQIESYVETRGMEMTASLEKMAWMPKGSKALDCNGAVCGFYLTVDNVSLYFLPGVTDQMRYLLDKFVLPDILSQYKTLPVLRQRILKLYGLSEPGIAETLKHFSGRTEDLILGFYPHFPENHITITRRGHDEPTVLSDLDRVEKEIRNLLGSYIFATGNQSMESVVGDMLTEKRLTISVAESCTGGLIGNLLTNVSGSSKYFLEGLVVYSNQSKVNRLNVSPKTIERYGAVSDQTVREMAQGVKKSLNTDIGLAVSGIAGPDGGTREKPVGTVFIGMDAGNEIFSRRYLFWGTREQIKQNTAIMALDWVRRYLNGDPFLPGI